MNAVARTYRQRAYRSLEDLARMRQLLVDGARSRIDASYMHPGVLDWATHYPPDEEANHRNLRLWERVDGGSPSLAACAIFFEREGSFDLFVHPALHGSSVHEAVMDEYVTWAETRARAARLKQIWPFWAMQQDSTLTRMMQAHGFVLEQPDPPPPLFERSLDALPEPRLPIGFTVQEVKTPDEGRLRARVTHAAFDLAADWDGYMKTYARFMRSPVYDGARDLFVRSPDGQGASACCIWYDAVNAVGLFKPVATHPDYQRRGLGKAVMAEGMRRMKAAGMRRAIVGFDPTNAAARALYTSLGFAASSYFTVAHKTV